MREVSRSRRDIADGAAKPTGATIQMAIDLFRRILGKYFEGSSLFSGIFSVCAYTSRARTPAH
jgi:hypothetical protein